MSIIGGSGTPVDHEDEQKAINGAVISVASSVTNSSFSNYTNDGLYITGGAPTLTTLTLTGGGNALEISGGSPSVSKTLIKGASYGVYAYGASTPSFDHDTIADNTSYGIYCSNATIGVSNSIVVRNGSYNAYSSSGTINANNDDFCQTCGSSGTSGISGTAGDFNSNPLFVSATDYHLTAN